MVSLQPVTFPLHPIVKTVHGPACACWKGPHCSRIGKHPAVEWREVSLENPSPGRIPGGGVGLRTGALGKGSGIIVVDIDSKEAAAWFDEQGGVGGKTKTVITGRPGIQYYFEHPGFHVPNSVGANGGLFPGLDIRGDGGFVVMPGSPHKSGRTYRTLNPDVPIATMPGWLKAKLLEHAPTVQEIEEYEGDVTDEDELVRRRRMYIEYLETAPPSIQGEGGDQALFEVVQYGAWDLALPTEDVLELVAEYFDPRCEPPWDHELEERVLHKAHFAKTSSNRPRRVPIHADEEKVWEEILAKPEALAFDSFLAGFKNTLEKSKAAVLDRAEQYSVNVPTNDYPDGPAYINERNEEPAEPKIEDPFKVQWGGWSVAPPPEKWLIKGLLHDNKVSMIYADPGSIKTWLAIALAISISSQRPFLGDMPVEGGPVLYLDFEDGAHEFHRRHHMLETGADNPNLGFSYSPDTLSSQDFWRKLATVANTRKLKLIVVDTLAGGTAGMDENSTEAAMPMMYAGKITEAVPNVSVLFLHHANKSGGLRGSSAFTAAVDTLFKLEKESATNDGGIEFAKLTCVKSGQKKVPTIELKLSDRGGLERNVKETKLLDEGINLFADAEKSDKRTIEDLCAEVSLVLSTRGPVASLDMLSNMTNGAKKPLLHTVLAELGGSGRAVQTAEGWVSDSDGLRRERLRMAIQSYPDAAKTKILALSYVNSAYFDRMLNLGHIRPVSSDRDISGFIWRETI